MPKQSKPTKRSWDVRHNGELYGYVTERTEAEAKKAALLLVREARPTAKAQEIEVFPGR